MNKRMTQRIALVTGASSGIGEALVRAMAENGTHVVLAARSAARLEQVAQTIRRAGGVATVVPCDLSRPDAAQRLYDDVTRLGLEVDTLVNNAGFGYHGPFESEPLEHLSGQLQVNMVAAAELTRLFLPSLLVHRGTVLNIASTIAFQPAPFMSVYGATKAFLLSFSEALWAEYHDRGLHVVALCPGPVETPFIDAAGPEVRDTTVFKHTLSIDQVVRECIAAMASSQPTRVVGWRNLLLSQSGRFSSRELTARIGAWMMRPRSLPVPTSTGDLA
jgi:short-subunit dehydrogenase